MGSFKKEIARMRTYQTDPAAPSENSGGFFKLSRDVTRRADLSPACKLIYALLADRLALAKRTGGACRAGIRRLAEDSGLDLGTVGTCIARLKRANLLTVKCLGSGRPNIYSLTPQSAWKNPAPEKPQRLKKPSASAGKKPAQAQGFFERTIEESLEEEKTPTGRAAPPRPPAKPAIAKPEPRAELGELVAAWACGYKAKLGRTMPDGERGRAVGVLKTMLQSFPAAELRGAVDRWWSAGRPDYGAGLFKTRLEGGAADLTGRKASGPGRFTPAPAGESLAGAVTSFDGPAGGAP